MQSYLFSYVIIINDFYSLPGHYLPRGNICRPGVHGGMDGQTWVVSGYDYVVLVPCRVRNRVQAGPLRSLVNLIENGMEQLQQDFYQLGLIPYLLQKDTFQV